MLSIRVGTMLKFNICFSTIRQFVKADSGVPADERSIIPSKIKIRYYGYVFLCHFSECCICFHYYQVFLYIFSGS